MQTAQQNARLDGHQAHWKKHSAEEIVEILGFIRGWIAGGVDTKEAILRAGISQATYFRWRARYGRVDADQLGLIKRLEAENARLRRALAAFESGADL